MLHKCLKSLLVLAFSLFLTVFATNAFASGEPENDGKGKLNMKEVIFGHIMDGHEFHFFNASIPLPVILYSPQKGFSTFMSSAFHHGEHEVEGYNLVKGKVVPTDHVSIIKMCSIQCTPIRNFCST